MRRLPRKWRRRNRQKRAAFLAAPTCPLCGVVAEGYEMQNGLAYQYDGAGPFGGPGTYLVAGGEEPPAHRGFGLASIAVIPWLSFVKLEPCGCKLLRDSFVIYSRTARGWSGVFRIEGEEFVDPL